MTMASRFALRILMCAIAVPAVAGQDAMRVAWGAQTKECETPSARMVRIPPGVYRPFFKQAAGKIAPTSAVPPFILDRAPVTRAEFLAFVCRYPQWRKSRVKALFAESTYLADWLGDLDPGTERLSEPVTHVSWFAARAYCSARNARLPTVAEWERAAGESTTDDAANQAPRDPRTPFRFAMGRAARDLHSTPLEFPGLWEWNADFNSALAAGGSRTSARAGSNLFCGDGYRATDSRDYGAFLRHSFRSSLRGNYTLKNLGFRCAMGE